MQAAHDGAMPPYFRFLTIMAFYVFVQEQVTLVLLPLIHVTQCISVNQIQ